MPIPTCAWANASGTINIPNRAKYLRYFIVNPFLQNPIANRAIPDSGPSGFLPFRLKSFRSAYSFELGSARKVAESGAANFSHHG
jgi:hypothetical protein